MFFGPVLLTQINSTIIFQKSRRLSSRREQVGALLGALTAARNLRHLLFIGGGSFQVSAQELSTIGQNSYEMPPREGISGPTPDKPTVTLSVPDPNHINSFMNFRVADIQACYELWKSRGAEFITPPIPKYGEIRCYIRDPDGYIIEVGQSTDLTYG